MKTSEKRKALMQAVESLNRVKHTNIVVDSIDYRAQDLAAPPGHQFALTATIKFLDANEQKYRNGIWYAFFDDKYFIKDYIPSFSMKPEENNLVIPDNFSELKAAKTKLAYQLWLDYLKYCK